MWDRSDNLACVFMHGLAVSNSHLLLLRCSWPRQTLRFQVVVFFLEKCRNRNVHVFAFLCLVLPCHLPPLSPILSVHRYERAVIRLTDHQPFMSVGKHSDTPLKLAGLTCTLDTHIFIHACTHTGSAMLRQLASTYMEYKTGQAGRLTLWYRLCFARRSHCNWSAFQSPSLSGKNAIKADSICWISFCQTHGPVLRFQLRNYQLCTENNNHSFSLPPASLEYSRSE